MRIARDGERYLVALEPGESVRTELEAICGKHDIRTGIIRHCIGAVKDLKLAFYELPARKYIPIEVDDDTYEVAAGQGNLTWKDGKPFLHMHVVATDREGMAGGGHLVDAIVAVTLEIEIVSYKDDIIVREYDDRVGLPVWRFPERKDGR